MKPGQLDVGTEKSTNETTNENESDAEAIVTPVIFLVSVAGGKSREINSCLLMGCPVDVPRCIHTYSIKAVLVDMVTPNFEAQLGCWLRNNQTKLPQIKFRPIRLIPYSGFADG